MHNEAMARVGPQRHKEGIKDGSATFFGTSVPSSGNTIANQKLLFTKFYYL
jgi:hypothetical protein